MYRYSVVLLILCLILACKSDPNRKIDISAIKGQVEVDRFDKKFYSIGADGLDNLKESYPYLFPEQNPDSIWIQRMNSPEELALFQEVENVLGDFKEQEDQIEFLFKHIKYHHETFEFPKVITLVTNLDYESKVMYADSLLFISLDMYLGDNSASYKEFPKYLSRNFVQSQMVVDVAKSIAGRYVPVVRNRPFINTLIEEGKKMYLVDVYLPEVSASEKMGYSEEDSAWLEANEGEIWKYFIENELLYSTDSDLYARFIAKAPFSKFYIDIDKESPGGVGVWLGWQIVKSYMKNNNVALQQMLLLQADELFNKSKYKPRK